MKVTRFEQIEKFRSFTLNKCRGKHSVCSFSFVAARFEEYSDLVGNNIDIIDENRVVMHGVISDIAFISGYSENIVEVIIISQSSKEDIKSFIRVFQKEGQTYKEIIDSVIRNMDYEWNVPTSLTEVKLAHPIIQYNETDFAFIRRMLHEGYGQDIIVDVENNRNIFAGYINNTKHEILSKEIVYMSHVLREETDRIEFWVSTDTEGYELRGYVDVGKQVIWKNINYIITKIEIEKKDSVYRYKCCGEKRKFDKKINKVKTNCLFKATVVEVEDPNHLGRIRLDFSDVNIEDMTSENKVWVDVLTPYTAGNGGFVFVPEKDDIVKVLWDGFEFSVAGCVRQEALVEKYQDVKLKQIGNLYDKNICWSDEKIEFTSKEANISLLDDEIHLSIADSDISMTKEKIVIRTNKSIVEVNDNIVAETIKARVDADELEGKIKKNCICESKNITLNASATVTIAGGKKVSIN